MKIPQRIKYINRGILVSPYYIALCQSPEAFNREMKRLKVPANQRIEWIQQDADGQVHEFESTDGKFHRICMVCIRPNKKRTKIATMGIIVHEAVHVWQAIVDMIGEEKPSPEFEAYSIGEISMNLMEAYKW